MQLTLKVLLMNSSKKSEVCICFMKVSLTAELMLRGWGDTGTLLGLTNVDYWLTEGWYWIFLFFNAGTTY